MTKRNVTRDPGVLAALRSVGGANALARKLGGLPTVTIGVYQHRAEEFAPFYEERQ